MRHMRRLLLTAAATGAAAALAATVPRPAIAHSTLVSASPANGEALRTAPAEVRLEFSGELDPDGSGFVVVDSAGAEVGDGRLDLTVADRNVVAGSVEITRPGTYTVAWTAVASDGHEESGTFSFGYVPGDATAPDTALPAPRPPLAELGLALSLAALTLAGRNAATRSGRPGVTVAGGLAVALALTGCIPGNGECEALPTDITLLVTTDSLTPSDPAVCRDRQITLRIESEVDGVLHVHGYDDELPATALRAGDSTSVTFTAARSGQFPIELHTDDEPSAGEIGILTVHEP